MQTRLSLLCDKVIEAGWLAALAVVPLFFNIYSQRVFEPDKLSLLRSLALVMAAAWIVRRAEDWRSGVSRPWTWRYFVQTPMVLPTLLLVVVYLISTVLSVSPMVSFLGSYQRLQGTYTTLSYIVIFFLALEGLRTRRQLDRIITVVILVSFPIALYGLVQHLGLDPLPWGGNVKTRVASNMGNAIFVAAYLIMVVPLTLSRLLANWRDAAGEVDVRDGLLGVLEFGLLATTTLALVMLRRGVGEVWLCWLGVALGIVLQVPIFLLSSATQRRTILTVALPLVFAFFVGLAWFFEVILKALGVPVASSQAEALFWYGLVCAVVFILAMASFSFFLRKPLTRLLLLASYFVILIAQVATILFTQSRGPLLGLLAGFFAYLALLGLVRRQVWLTWLTAALAAGALLFLVLFNAVESPWLNRLRDVPIVGRLGQVLQTEEGTGKVRVLIWEGAAEMITWHAPLDFPGEDGRPDTLNALRPIIGYGPESMYVAYNRFYPPELAHYEKRNASPDRSHNETFDALVMTGAVGFLVYMFVFTSVFYYALKWLALIQKRWETQAFLGLWIVGGLSGAVAAWAWRGPAYVGVGIPLGVMLGMGLYVLLQLLRTTLARHGLRHSLWLLVGLCGVIGILSGAWLVVPVVALILMVGLALAVAGLAIRAGLQSEGEPYSMLVLALLAATVAHFVEIHFGIAIAATRTYFWVYVAALVVVGVRLRAQAAEEALAEGAGVQSSGGSATDASQTQPEHQSLNPSGGHSQAERGKQPQVRGRRRGRRSVSEAPRSRPRRHLPEDLDWRGSLTVWSLVTILVLSTMLFNSITIQRSQPLPEDLREAGSEADIAQWREDHPPGLWGNLWYSVTVKDDELKPVMLGLLLATWGMLGLVFLSESRDSREVATAGEPGGKRAVAWIVAGGAFGAVTLIGTFLFAVIHTSQLVLLRIPLQELLDRNVPLANPLARTITTYYLFVLLIVLGLALGLTFLFRRSVRSQLGSGLRPQGGRLTNLAVILLTLIAAALVGLLIYGSNINIVRADIYYKQGLSYENVEQWDVAVRYYEEAIDIAPNQDFYYLFLGRALMEKAKGLEGSERQEGFQKSEQALLTARRIAPLNTDHSANLARLYRTWGGLSSGQQSVTLLQQSLSYYQAANSLSPNNAQILNEWGQTYLAMGDSAKGLEKYGESLVLDPGFGDTCVRVGEYYTLQEDWEQAVAAYQRAVQLKPKSAEAFSSLGYANSKMGNLEAALEAYKRAVELKPKNYNHRRNLAVVYRELGRTEDAIREGFTALDLAPANQKQALRNFLADLGVEGIGLSTEESQLLQQLLADGRENLDAKEWAAAEPYYVQALELDPSNAQAHMELAYAYAQLGRIDEAIRENQTVSRLQPLDYGSHTNLAILYQQIGDYAQAIVEAEQALDLAPEGQKANLEAFLEQLRALQAAQTEPTPAPTPAGPVARAGDLAPEQRAGMYGEPPAMTIDVARSYRATIVTAAGNIVVELAIADAPQTVNNFVYLARQGFYDGLTFHRVEDSPAFALIQGGDPLGTGTGGPGYTVPAEIGLPHEQGAIAMARLGDQLNPEKASSGSQFYICLVPIHQLDGGYTVFGYVSEGLDVAERITAGEQILTIVITED